MTLKMAKINYPTPFRYKPSELSVVEASKEPANVSGIGYVLQRAPAPEAESELKTELQEKSESESESGNAGVD